MVPLFALKAHDQAVKGDVQAQINRDLEFGQYIMGPKFLAKLYELAIS